MIMGCLGKRPQLDAPLNNSTANTSVEASSYPYSTNVGGSFNYNVTYSEYGEYHFRATPSSRQGLRYSNLGTAIGTEVNTNGTFVSLYMKVLIETKGTGGYTVYNWLYNGSTSEQITFYELVSGTAVKMTIEDTTSNVDVDHSATLSTGTWYNFTGVYTTGEGLQYKDGVRVTATNGSSVAVRQIATYGGFGGNFGTGTVNPVGTGTTRWKNVLYFLDKLNMGDIHILESNNGRINY